MNWNDCFATRTSRIRRSAVRELLKLSAQPGMISFAGGLPSPELLPIEQVARAADSVLTHKGQCALQYGETEGMGELRDWIAARFFREGRAVDRSHVLITTGAQQALDLLGRVFVDEGDSVIVENPTYMALLSAWRPFGARFCPVPADTGGMQMEQMGPLLAHRPKLVYCVPNFQNPQGTTLALERRLQLLKLLEQQNLVLVEDNPYGSLRYEGDPVPHLFEMDQSDGRVAHTGTFSKTIAPGLRVGWIVAPPPAIEKLTMAKQAMDLHTSTLCQHILYQMLCDGLLEKQLPRLRQAYQQRRDTMLAALEKWFPPQTSWTRPEGGLFLMVTLPPMVNAAELLKLALQQGVAFVPGEEFHLGGVGQNTMRLNFSHPAVHLIEEGVKRLSLALRQLLEQARK